MIKAIKIEIDTEKKSINKVEAPQDMSALEIAKVMLGISNSYLESLKEVKKENKKETDKIITPKMIVNP